MKLGLSFLKSKVARRMFALFILCAMCPVMVLSVLVYSQVSKQLKDQSFSRLRNSAKAHSQSVFERFLFFDNSLRMVGVGQAGGNKDLPEVFTDIESDGNLFQRFKALGIINASGQIHLIHGEFNDLPADFTDRALAVKAGKTTIFFEGKGGQNPSNVYMVTRIANDPSGLKVLAGKIDTIYLWGIGPDNILPPMTDLCIIDDIRKTLTTDFLITDSLIHQIVLKSDGIRPRSFQYKDANNDYFVGYAFMYLPSRFNAPRLGVILRNNGVDVFAPLSQFKVIFPLVILLSFWVVLLLSLIYIRKSLKPLAALKKGTLRLAKKDFKSQVVINSNDEFEELADSFNSMSHQLNRHFDVLTTLGNIDRAILSSLSTSKIIHTVLNKMLVFFSCDSASVNLVTKNMATTLHAHILNDTKIRKPREEFFQLTPGDTQLLKENPGHILVQTKQDQPNFLAATDIETKNSFLVLPLVYDDVLKGTITLGHSEEKSFSENDIAHARQIADQFMVALYNASLVEKMAKLNVGTLEALANAIDAKSEWTAGHSERVTSLCLKIAKVMGYTQKELDVLQRAAYLHDIGKIGIPVAILNKPSRLSDEEYKEIKDHPLIGWRILEPIEAYEDVLHIVAQHHEKYNGQGYPFGLSGDSITLGARILAVADVYDAVVSDRPYRCGWVQDNAISHIKEGSGEHFDPMVVDAFLAAV